MTDLRTYIPGMGSSGALIAAVVVAFFALGGIVAIKGLPESSDPASAGIVLVETGPRDDVTAVEASAATPAKRADVDPRPGRDTSGGEPGGGGNDGNSPPAGEGTPQPVDPSPAPTDPPGLTPPAPDPPDPSPQPQPPPPPNPQPQPPPTPPQPAPPKGPVGGLVEGADGAVGDIVGFHPGIAEAVVPITGPIDGVIGVITNPIPLPEAPGPTDAGVGN